MQINGLKDALKSIKVHEPSLPSPGSTPKPERGKVVRNPVREPINRQAARIMAPNRSWITQPLPPEKLKTKEDVEIERLIAVIKTERNQHALTRDDLGVARAQIKKAKHEIQHLQEEVKALQSKCAQKDETIRQLEDLKL